MAFGDDSAVPIPWGAVLVVGVLAVSLMALGTETASSPRTRKMRANGTDRWKRDTLDPGWRGVLSLLSDGSVSFYTYDTHDVAYFSYDYDNMEAFRKSWNVKKGALIQPGEPFPGWRDYFHYDAVKSWHVDPTSKKKRTLEMALSLPMGSSLRRNGTRAHKGKRR